MLVIIFLLFLLFSLLKKSFNKIFLPIACHWPVGIWLLWFVKIVHRNIVWHDAEILESLFVLICSFDYARALWVIHTWRLPAALSLWILAPFLLSIWALRHLGGASQTILKIFGFWVHLIMEFLNFVDCWRHITRSLIQVNWHLNSTFRNITDLYGGHGFSIRASKASTLIVDVLELGLYLILA